MNVDDVRGVEYVLERVFFLLEECDNVKAAAVLALVAIARALLLIAAAVSEQNRRA